MLCHREFMAVWTTTTTTPNPPPPFKASSEGVRFEFLLEHLISSQDAGWHYRTSLYRDHSRVAWCFFRISLSVLLNPADPWLPPFSVIPFEGPVGDSSHLEEVLNHNIFSGSSWECVVIKERGWRSSWRSVLLWPLRSVWSRCRIHSLPVYPARVARPNIYSIHTFIQFFFSAAGSLLTYSRQNF